MSQSGNCVGTPLLPLTREHTEVSGRREERHDDGEPLMSSGALENVSVASSKHNLVHSKISESSTVNLDFQNA